MIDIHTHILPGLDDGARDFDEACAMAEMAVSSGVKGLIVTPHSNDPYGYKNESSDDLKRHFTHFREILKKERLPINVYPGMEILASMDVVEKLKMGRLWTLNGSKYVLVEFAFEEEVWWMEGILDEIRRGGFIPIIAHPERYACIQEQPNLLFDWYIKGCHAQMNKGSILGRFGHSAEVTADLFLRHYLYSCIASDAHRRHIRTTDMNQVKKYMQQHYSNDYSRLLFEINPLNVLQNQRMRMMNRPRMIDK